MEPRVSKCQRVIMDNNEEGQSLGKYEDKNERRDVRYVPLPFVAPSSPRKESNRPTDICEEIKSLNHLVCISKIGLSYNC